MQPNPVHSNTLKIRSQVGRVAKKEVALFFASPTAYLFLAAFAAVTLFVFFWGEAFFARNIADVRPLFEWMPLLLIFLASTLTMRLWSEERRTGTLEYVLTQPVPLWHFVIGKFIGCLILLLIALAITLPLPITVAIIGELDWGPVVAGYLATFLLGAAYLSIGLFVSARTQNQIVSLIIAVALCGIFYMLGAKTLTKLVGYETAEWLRLLGTGSRFDAITRGVIDFRDLYYYLSIIIVFLALNVYSLESERWSANKSNANHGAWRAVTLLLVLNAVGTNIWLDQVNDARIDATAGKQYSISNATKNYLQQLQEPLLIRGYFSGKTHPLLSPLVPQLRDLIREYEIAGKGRVRIEFIDPTQNPELEEEANQKYGIQAVPFQVADRYQSSIVSSYFNVLIQYGSEHQTLGFNDLIEVKSREVSDINVQLRNPEHDLTRAIKKVLKSYQTGGNLFDTVKGQLTFDAYISNNAKLPKQLIEFKKQIEQSVASVKQNAGDRLHVSIVDPQDNGGQVAQRIAQDFGFQPMGTSLFSQDTFYFYMTLTKDDQIVQIPIDDMSKDGFEHNLNAAIKRFASGFTKNVALVPPPAAPQFGGHGQPAPQQNLQFNQLQQFIGSELNIKDEDLSDGRVSGDSDILVVLAPKDLDRKQLFAVDQFLMQGGTVVIASSPFSANFGGRQIRLQNNASGLEDWLSHHGLAMQKSLVMDSQNTAFPIPVTRNVGGFQLQDVRMLDYPYFIDIRSKGLNKNNVITANIPQLTMAWASPIKIDSTKQADRSITELIYSSQNSWLSSSTDIMPKVSDNGVESYRPDGEQKSHLLGVISEGRFDSYFAGKESPLLSGAEADNTEPDSNDTEQQSEEARDGSFEVSSIIEKSSNSARIILFSSNDFMRDSINGVLSSTSGSQYLNTMQLMANTLDWSLEDSGLLSIRSRGHFNRTLPPMEQSSQAFWEYLNYALAALALVIVALLRRFYKQAQRRQYQQLISA